MDTKTWIINPKEFCDVNQIEGYDRAIICLTTVGDVYHDTCGSVILLTEALNALNVLIDLYNTEPAKAEDADVKAQNHYARFPIQHMQFAQMNQLSWCAANVTKYVTRYAFKNGKEDLKKAKHYLEKLIEYKEKGTISLPSKAKR